MRHYSALTKIEQAIEVDLKHIIKHSGYFRLRNKLGHSSHKSHTTYLQEYLLQISTQSASPIYWKSLWLSMGKANRKDRPKENLSPAVLKLHFCKIKNLHRRKMVKCRKSYRSKCYKQKRSTGVKASAGWWRNWRKVRPAKAAEEALSGKVWGTERKQESAKE